MVTHMTVCASDAEAASLVLHVMSDCYVGLDCSLSLAGSGAARCVGSGGGGLRVDARVQQRRAMGGDCVSFGTHSCCSMIQTAAPPTPSSNPRSKPKKASKSSAAPPAPATWAVGMLCLARYENVTIS